jgi:hypothetical protein
MTKLIVKTKEKIIDNKIFLMDATLILPGSLADLAHVLFCKKA